MKKHDKNLEKNISRLIKSTRGGQLPSQAFTEDLIDAALGELNGADRREVERKHKMKKSVKTFTAIAASIILLAVVSAAIYTQTLGKVRRKSSDLALKKENYSYQRAEEVRAREMAAVDRLPEPEQKVAASQPRVDAGAVSAAKPEVYKTYLEAASESLPPGMLPKEEAVRASDTRVSKYNWRGESSSMADQGAQMPHGGTTPPNDEPVDAMFFKNYGVNPFVDTEDDHLSTFAIDVDTGAYTMARAYLRDGHLPPNDSVRVEEFVNSFYYDYAAPQESTFAVYADARPWSFGAERKNTYLLRIGLKAKQIAEENRKPANLVFVIDVSGSMGRDDRLGLVKRSLELLVDKLRADDRIGIAVYGSRGHKVLEPTSVANRSQILEAIRSLRTEGSTNAEEGITIGYEMASRAYEEDKINRVILCSDGVANVGRTGADSILEVIRDKAAKGITLSCLGFGMGNYNDVLMEQLGNKGDGYYAYIDTFEQAKKLFGNLTGALQVVARDVKIQVDFNPQTIRSYRLIGYENRDVPDDKFRDDKWDGGEIGAGHATTAFYELKLWPGKTGAVATTHIRYKDPDTREVTEVKSLFGTADMNGVGEPSRDYMLGETVVEFAEILRESYWAKGATLGDTLAKAQKLAELYKGSADVTELVDMIAKAKALQAAAEESKTEPEIEPEPVPVPGPEPRPLVPVE